MHKLDKNKVLTQIKKEVKRYKIMHTFAIKYYFLSYISVNKCVINFDRIFKR